MEFKLFSKLASLEGIELTMLLGALVVLGLLIWAVAAYAKRAKTQAAAAPETATSKPSRTQTLVYGALSITLAFVLSYFKLFSLPLGGTITLLSMLPIFAYAAYFGPLYGYTAAFFPKNLPVGAAIAGFLRMIASTVSGAIFFQDVGMEYGFANPWVYSFIYNFLTIGVDTILCVVVAALPPVQRLFKRVFIK